RSEPQHYRVKVDKPDADTEKALVPGALLTMKGAITPIDIGQKEWKDELKGSVQDLYLQSIVTPGSSKDAKDGKDAKDSKDGKDEANPGLDEGDASAPNAPKTDKPAGEKKPASAKKNPVERWAEEHKRRLPECSFSIQGFGNVGG